MSAGNSSCVSDPQDAKMNGKDSFTLSWSFQKCSTIFGDPKKYSDQLSKRIRDGSKSNHLWGITIIPKMMIADEDDERDNSAMDINTMFKEYFYVYLSLLEIGDAMKMEPQLSKRSIRARVELSFLTADGIKKFGGPDMGSVEFQPSNSGWNVCLATDVNSDHDVESGVEVQEFGFAWSVCLFKDIPQYLTDDSLNLKCEIVIEGEVEQTSSQVDVKKIDHQSGQLQEVSSSEQIPVGGGREQIHFEPVAERIQLESEPMEIQEELLARLEIPMEEPASVKIQVEHLGPIQIQAADELEPIQVENGSEQIHVDERGLILPGPETLQIQVESEAENMEIVGESDEIQGGGVVDPEQDQVADEINYLNKDEERVTLRNETRVSQKQVKQEIELMTTRSKSEASCVLKKPKTNPSDPLETRILKKSKKILASKAIKAKAVPKPSANDTVQNGEVLNPVEVYCPPEYSDEEKKRLYGDKQFVMDVKDVGKRQSQIYIWEILLSESVPCLRRYEPGDFYGHQFHLRSVFTLPLEMGFQTEAFYKSYQPLFVNIVPVTEEGKHFIHYPYVDQDFFRRMAKNVGAIYKTEYLRQKMMMCMPMMILQHIANGRNYCTTTSLLTNPERNLGTVELSRLCYIQAWREMGMTLEEIITEAKFPFDEKTTRILKTFPALRVLRPRPWQKGLCTACQSTHKREFAVRVFFTPKYAGGPQPYDPATLLDIPVPEIPNFNREEPLHWCKECLKAAKIFHELTHFFYNMYRVLRQNTFHKLAIFRQNKESVTEKQILIGYDADVNWRYTKFLELQICIAEFQAEFVNK